MKLAELYIIREGSDGPIKIGRSVSALTRLASLQTGNPRLLHLVASFQMEAEVVITAEKYLHEELGAFALVGEWFDLSDEFLSDYMPDFFRANGFEVVC